MASHAKDVLRSRLAAKEDGLTPSFALTSSSSLANPPLACTVRDCGLPLERRDRAYVCPRGHSYDIARAGYLNLLQPQDRRSLTAGDPPAAVEARGRLLDAGIGRALLSDLVRCLTTLPIPENASVADLGAGTGDALAACVGERMISGVGIDLSTAAARHASRRFPQLTWVVANADRRLPLLDRRMTVLMSLHGRRNPAECARVLAPRGWLVVAVPAPDDLIELRTLIQGAGVERSRVDTVVAEHEPFFKPVDRFATREHHTLSQASLVDLLRVTYRGARTSVSQKAESLSTMNITLASDCLLFEKLRT
jgi:23S rRNA (guanine745-N1)-methyltransferase